MSPATAQLIQTELRRRSDPAAAAFAARYFKTGPGEYAEGDVFLGLRVPILRTLSRTHRGLPIAEVTTLLQSAVHEDRLIALLILTEKFPKADEPIRKAIYSLYLANTAYINNWDLVDCSAAKIVGAYLQDKSRKPLDQFVRSSLLWERRISVIATAYFIQRDDFADTLRLCERLLTDRHDLIQKATGWMLREVGKRDLPTLETFLDQHSQSMPRTMLRYAIERFPEPRRLAYLRGTSGDNSSRARG